MTPFSCIRYYSFICLFVLPRACCSVKVKKVMDGYGGRYVCTVYVQSSVTCSWAPSVFTKKAPVFRTQARRVACVSSLESSPGGSPTQYRANGGSVPVCRQHKLCQIRDSEGSDEGMETPFPFGRKRVSAFSWRWIDRVPRLRLRVRVSSQARPAWQGT